MAAVQAAVSGVVYQFEFGASKTDRQRIALLIGQSSDASMGKPYMQQQFPHSMVT